MKVHEGSTPSLATKESSFITKLCFGEAKPFPRHKLKYSYYPLTKYLDTAYKPYCKIQVMQLLKNRAVRFLVILITFCLIPLGAFFLFLSLYLGSEGGIFHRSSTIEAFSIVMLVSGFVLLTSLVRTRKKL